MQAIDITSILFLFVLTCTFIALFFTIDAILFKKRDKTTLIYIASKYIQAVAIGVLTIQGYNNNIALIISHNVLYFTGIAGEVYAIIGINSTKKNLHRSILLTTVILASLYNVINLVMDLSHAYRLFVVGIFSFFIFFYLAVALLLKKDNSKMQKVTGWFSLIFAVPWGLRTYYVLMNLSTAELFNPNWLQTIAYIGTIVFFSVLPLLYLLIFKEKDQQKLQMQYSKIVNQNSEIRCTNDQLKALNATKDFFFRLIGHDLRGPIGQIVKLFQLIEKNYKDMNDEDLMTYIKAMKESSIRGFKLLDNLLEWASSQTGNISFNPEPISISELIRENIELLKEQAETKNIRIKTSNFYGERITIDRNMINTVVRNLLSNAIKFTRNAGEIEISAHTDKNDLIVSIKDNGVGISSEKCKELFRIGSEHTTVGTNNEKGTGIGLILCKEFIDKHNGAIWADSKQNEGSIFYFSIPMSKQQYI